MVVLLASVGYAVWAYAGPNADAVLSLDLIADGGAGNGTDGIVTDVGTTIAIEVFVTGVTTSLRSSSIKFDFDASLLAFVNAENSAFPLTLPEASVGTNLASGAPSRWRRRAFWRAPGSRRSRT